jgi:hypothetical protein
MDITEARELLANLRVHGLRNRVGLWLMPADQISKAESAAAILGIDGQDARQLLLEQLPADTQYAGLSVETLVGLLENISEQQAHSDCVLVYNFDLLISGLSYADQQEVWRTLWESFPYRRRALLMTMPNLAEHLLPKPAELGHWRRQGRLVGELATLSQ